jgi:hypothetical protein
MPIEMPSVPDPTIEDLKALQERLDMKDVHVCWLGDTTFVIAHTDEERASIPLEECELHQWLLSLASAPEPVGYYQAVLHVADLDSESYGAYPWDFHPLEVSGG